MITVFFEDAIKDTFGLEKEKRYEGIFKLGMLVAFYPRIFKEVIARLVDAQGIINDSIHSLAVGILAVNDSNIHPYQPNTNIATNYPALNAEAIKSLAGCLNHRVA